MAFWVDFLFRARSAHITYSLFTEQKPYLYTGG